MLTPRFTLTQTADFVDIALVCPYIKASEVEIDIDGTHVRFYAHPYFLRLTLPARLIEDGRERSSYDIDSGLVTLHIPKETSGEHFDDLDLLSKLMDVRGKPAGGGAASIVVPGIDMSGESMKPSVNSTTGAHAAVAAAPMIIEMDAPTGQSIDSVQETGQDMSCDDQEDEIDWSFPQTLPDPTTHLTGSKYGFNDQHSGYGETIRQVANELLDIPDLDQSTRESRRQRRIELEDAKFDDEHYMYDYINDEEIQRLIKYRPAARKALREIQDRQQQLSDENACRTTSGSTTQVHEFLTFSEQEQDQMRQLSNRSYIIDAPMEQCIYLGLVDILFAYCYNMRTTECDDTVESAWTVCKLSGTLSCFDLFTSLPEVISCSVRRSLSYPLYRNMSLTTRVMEDVVVYLKLGRRAILHALLHIHKLLERDDVAFVVDRVWVTDYCVWVQHQAMEKRVVSLGSELHRWIKSGDEPVSGTGDRSHEVSSLRDVVGDWHLDELERLAREAAVEQSSEQPMNSS